MFQTKRRMAVVVTALLLMLSMILTACGGGGDVKKDAGRTTSPLRLRMSQDRRSRSKSRQSALLCSGVHRAARL